MEKQSQHEPNKREWLKRLLKSLTCVVQTKTAAYSDSVKEWTICVQSSEEWFRKGTGLNRWTPTAWVDKCLYPTDFHYLSREPPEVFRGSVEAILYLFLCPREAPCLKGREGIGSNTGPHPFLPLNKSQTWWGKGRFLSGDILQDVYLRSAEWRKERNQSGPCYQWKWNLNWYLSMKHRQRGKRRGKTLKWEAWTKTLL